MSKFKEGGWELSLLTISPELSSRLKEVKTGQIMDNNNNFHPEGLFSAEIFGRVGTSKRTVSYGKIVLNTKILHPKIYKTIVDLGSLYSKIMEGKETVIFDEEKGDFEPSVDYNAKTGYEFFMSVIDKVKFKETNSRRRSKSIELVESSIKDGSAFMTELLVSPAGIRDYTVSESGKSEESEINSFYRRILSTTSLIDPVRCKRSPVMYDRYRIGLQKNVYAIFEYIILLVSGKTKVIQSKWTARKVFNTSFNVLSGYVDTTPRLDDPRRLKFNTTRVGVWQFARVTNPISTYHIKNKYLAEIFGNDGNTVFLTDQKTLQLVEVPTSGMRKDIDLLTTNDGIEKLVASLGNVATRSQPITLDGPNRQKFYLGLLYKDDKTFKFFRDIRELPKDLNKNNVTPITLFELIYMSIYHMNEKYPVMITRYPVKESGSVVTNILQLATTDKTSILTERESDWSVDTSRKDNVAIFFPDLTSSYIDTLTLQNAYLPGLGGDFDGDTGHVKSPLSDEAVAEAMKLLRRKEYYIAHDGKPNFPNGTVSLDAVFKFLSR